MTALASDSATARPVSDALTVADDVLKIAKSLERALTPMQLVKLVYIAHGWHLALIGRDLFADRIEAWKYGPVIPNLYRATKQYGRNAIPFSRIADGPRSITGPSGALIEDVVRKYQGFSGIELSRLTHQPGTPWEQVYRDGELNIEIPDELIRRHYLALNEQRRAA